MPGGTYEDNWDISQPTFVNKLAYFITFSGEKNVQKFVSYSLAIFYDFVLLSTGLINVSTHIF